MYRCYCECCRCETPHDDIFDFDGIYSHCLSCGHLTLDHLCDEEELENIYAKIFREELEKNGCEWYEWYCNDEIEL